MVCPPLGLGQWPGLPPGKGRPSLPDPTTPFSRKETDTSRQVIQAEVWTPLSPWVSLVWRHLPILLLPPHSFLETLLVLIYPHPQYTPQEGQWGWEALEAVDQARLVLTGTPLAHWHACP